MTTIVVNENRWRKRGGIVHFNRRKKHHGTWRAAYSSGAKPSTNNGNIIQGDSNMRVSQALNYLFLNYAINRSGMMLKYSNIRGRRGHPHNAAKYISTNKPKWLESAASKRRYQGRVAINGGEAEAL